MPDQIKSVATCCAALELSKSSWLCAINSPHNGKTEVHKIKARDVAQLIDLLRRNKMRAEKALGRPVEIALCYEVGYDGFWIARLLIENGIRTVVFDPASFLMPRRGRNAKTDRLDAEGMTRTLRKWLNGDCEIARSVQIPSVEQEDAKRLERERKNLVEQRTSIVARIKALLSLHGIWITAKGISKKLIKRLDDLKTGDGRHLAPFLRRDVERMLRHHAFICEQITEVEADRRKALSDGGNRFPHSDKVQRLEELRGIGETSATVLVAEVYHRSFATRRHVASFVGLAPSPYKSGDMDRDRGISKAGTKLARQTFVELAWFWLRYQPESQLSLWWNERFANQGMRGRKVGIVALARKLAIALWRFLEEGLVPEGATFKVKT